MNKTLSAPKKSFRDLFSSRVPGIALLGILVLIALFISGCTNCPGKCQGECFDPLTQSCCNGQVYTGNWTVCGSECYNTNSAVCYQGKVYEGPQWRILGTWEADADPRVTITFHENGSVGIDPFPQCGNSVEDIFEDWSCDSSVLSDGTWSFEDKTDLYDVKFNYLEIWRGYRWQTDIERYGYGFDRNAEYNRYRLFIPDSTKIKDSSKISDSVAFTAQLDPKDPKMMRLSIVTPPVNYTVNPDYGSTPYSLEWITKTYGTWRHYSGTQPSGTARVPESALTSAPAAGSAPGPSSGKDLEITDYHVQLFNNGTLVERVTYRVNVPGKYYQIHRVFPLPLTFQPIDRPHAVVIGGDITPGADWYVKEWNGNVTISNQSLEGRKKLVETASRENELGMYLPSGYSAGDYYIEFTYDLHPSINVDEHYAFVKVRLPESKLPYGTVRILIPAEYVVELYPQPEDLSVTEEGGNYILSGYVGEDTSFGFDVLFSNKITEELEGFSS